MNKDEMPLDPAQRWEWIKYQLRLRGTSLAKLAKGLKVTGPAVKNAKLRPYPRIEREIAKALGLSPCSLWPERWNHDGTPKRQRPKRSEKNASHTQKDNSARVQRHRKTGTEN